MRALILASAFVAALTGAGLAQQVGVTAAVNQSAVGAPPAKPTKTLVIGDEIIHNEQITTDGKGLLQILLADGSSFTVGPSSKLTIDSFVYDPDANSAKIVATLGTGVFRFIGGVASKQPGGVTLNTPVGTVGLRGGIGNLDFSGATLQHIDLVYGTQVTLKDGTQVIGDVHTSGYSIVIGSNGKVGVQKTPPEWTAAFQQLMAGKNAGTGVNGNKVGTAVGNSNKGTPPSNQPPPADTPPQVPEPDSPYTTWAQIDNSQLADAYATYYGLWSATINGPGYGDGEERTDQAFLLDYYFHDRTGDAYFGTDADYYESPDDVRDGFHYFGLPVTAEDPTGNGPATFGFHNEIPVTQSICIGCTATGTANLDGFFLNTPDGTAAGVGGTFDLGLTGLSGGDYSVVGAFGANLDHFENPG